MDDTRSTVRRGVRAGVVAIGITVAAVVASVAVAVVVFVLAALLAYDVFSLPVLVAGLIAGQLGFLLVGVWYTRRHDRRIPISWPTRRGVGSIVGGTALALGVAFGGLVLLDAIGLLPDSAIEETAAIDPVFLLVLAVLSIVLVAPVEEFLFRGVIQGRLRDSVGPIPAILGASLLFGAIHVPNYIGSPADVLAGALLIVVVGIVLGALYELTDNLVVPIAVHAVYNVILLSVSYLAL